MTPWLHDVGRAIAVLGGLMVIGFVGLVLVFVIVAALGAILASI